MTASNEKARELAARLLKTIHAPTIGDIELAAESLDTLTTENERLQARCAALAEGIIKAEALSGNYLREESFYTALSDVTFLANDESDLAALTKGEG